MRDRWRDRQTNRHDGTDSCFPKFCDCAWKKSVSYCGHFSSTYL